MLFFGTTALGAMATAAGVSCVKPGPLDMAVLSAFGAIQGVVGAWGLTLLGYGGYSLLAAGMMGAMAGAAIGAPLTLLFGVQSFFNNDKDKGLGVRFLDFSLRVALMFVTSLVLSTSLMLGAGPAIAVAAGAAVGFGVWEGVKYALS